MGEFVHSIYIIIINNTNASSRGFAEFELSANRLTQEYSRVVISGRYAELHVGP